MLKVLRKTQTKNANGLMRRTPTKGTVFSSRGSSCLQAVAAVCSFLTFFTCGFRVCGSKVPVSQLSALRKSLATRVESRWPGLQTSCPAPAPTALFFPDSLRDEIEGSYSAETIKVRD